MFLQTGLDDFPKCFNLFTYERLIEMFLG